MNAVWLLSLSLIGSDSRPADKLQLDGLPESPYTLEQVRAGLEALSTGWIDREIHYVKLPLREPDGGPANPNRIEGTLRQSHKGLHLLDALSYQEGRIRARFYWSWDDQREMVASFSEPTADAEPKSARIRSLQFGTPHYYPSPVDLKYREVPIYEWLSLPSAKVIGESTIDDAKCVRLEVTLPKGFLKFGQHAVDPVLLVLDCDPALDFWPRLIVPIKDRERDRRGLSIEFDDFRGMGNGHFPHYVRRGDSVYLILKVAMNMQMSDSMFQLKLPQGTAVRNDLDGSKHYVGGKDAAIERLRLYRSSVAENAEEATEAVTTNSSILSGTTVAIGIALTGVLLLAAAVIWSRRTGETKS